MRSEPMAAARLWWLLAFADGGRGGGGGFVLQICLPCTTAVVHQSRHLNLDAVDAVDRVDEEDEDENKGDLHAIL